MNKEEELKQEANKYAKEITEKYVFMEHGRASALGYLAGAEPREKRIEELIALINAERERQEKCDDVHLRKITELEKENAELKERVREQSERISELTQELDDIINRFE